MGTVTNIRQTPLIFVAVGLAISPADQHRLQRPAPWGARLARTTQGKAWHRGTRNASAPSYVDASLVDLMLCREASWLVGWSGSTFSRTLARYQKLDHNQGWYSACPFVDNTPAHAQPPGVTYVPEDWHDHRACAGPKVEHGGKNRSAAGHKSYIEHSSRNRSSTAQT